MVSIYESVDSYPSSRCFFFLQHPSSSEYHLDYDVCNRIDSQILNYGMGDLLPSRTFLHAVFKVQR